MNFYNLTHFKRRTFHLMNCVNLWWGVQQGLQFFHFLKKIKEGKRRRSWNVEEENLIKFPRQGPLISWEAAAAAPQVRKSVFCCSSVALSHSHTRSTRVHTKRGARSSRKKKTSRSDPRANWYSPPALFSPDATDSDPMAFPLFFFSILNNAIIFLEYFSSVGRSSIFQQNCFLI